MSTAQANEIRQRLNAIKTEFDPKKIFDEEVATLSVTRPIATYRAKR